MTTAGEGRSGLLTLAGLCVVVVAAGAVYLRRAAPEPTPAPSAPRPAKLEVAYGGCHEVHAGPVCLVAETSTITLWLEDPGFVPTVRLDGAVAPTRVADVDGGVQLKVRVAPGVKALSVGEGEVETPWSLRTDHRASSPLVRRVKQMRNGGLEAAWSLASTATPEDPHERAELLSLLARLERDLGRSEWLDTVARSIELHRTNGCITGAANDLAFMSYRLRVDGELRGARSALEGMADLIEVAPELRVSQNYFLAAVDQQAGDARTALERLRAMDRWGERLDDETYRLPGMQMKLLLLSFLSRTSDAASLLKELSDAIDETEAPCERAWMLNNLAWFGRTIDANASVLAAQRGLSIYRGECNDSSNDEVLLRLTYARLLLLDNKIDDAADAVGDLRAVWNVTSGAGRVELDELDAQVRLARGDATNALLLFESVLERSSMQVDPRVYWSALLGIARSEVTLERVEKALEALDAAERALDGLVLAIPLGEGRTLFAEEHVESSILLIELLISRGEIERAHRVATHSIRRHSSALALSARISALPDLRRSIWEERVRAYRDARKRLSAEAEMGWGLPQAELEKRRGRRRAAEEELTRNMEALMSIIGVDLASRAPRLPQGVGELVLHPAKDGIFALIRRTTETVATYVPGDREGAWLEGIAISNVLRDGMKGLGEVRLLTYGELNDVDVSPTIRALTAESPVIGYSMGLPRSLGTTMPRRALVVSDPDGSLPRARSESNFVRERLTSQGWRVDLISGADADRDRLLALLSDGGYGLMHFAGHSASDAIDGWRSYLRLANGDRLEVADVFSIDSAPTYVVLSSCYGSGRGAAPIGIAQAFLARGARAVLAATGPVEDSRARTVMERLYEQEPSSPPEARLAAVQWSSRGSDASVAAHFRAYVR